MKRNKIVLVLMLLTLSSFLLSGCGHTHVWNEATCTEPKTCSECGKTEGEPSGHTWEEATCAAPKTCSECGETEGEPLEHTWEEATCAAPKTCTVCGATEGDALPHELTEANYQSPATCTVCGATEGEALQGDFDKHGLVCNVELDKVYPYTTRTNKNKDAFTNGTVVFSNYRTFDSDEEHEGVEGYEWKSVDITFTYDDDNAWDYGTTTSLFQTDFYVCEPKGETGDKDESEVGVLEENETETVNYNGIDYTECLNEDHALVMEWNDHVYTCKIQYAVRLPIGYDGCVVGAICDGQYNEGDYIYDVADENTLFFRFE